MFDNLTGLGIGLVTFALVVGIGIVMLTKFGGTVGGDAGTNLNYLAGQLGQGGLAGWTPAIIAFSVGMLFLGAFLIGKGKGRRY